MRRGILCVQALLLLFCCRGQGFPVAITELMPNPMPSRGLPAEEFVEIWNNSTDTLDLAGWVLTNGRSRARFPPGSFILPDSLLLLCKAAAVDSFTRYGRVLGLSRFPALLNDGDTIWLQNAGGEVVHAVGYTARSYGGSPPGGRSLELADTERPCRLLGSWRASTDSAGGNPGILRKGIVKNKTPVSFYAFSEEAQILLLQFNERSSHLPLLTMEPATTIDSVVPAGIMGNRWRVYLREALLSGTPYTIHIDSYLTCDTVLTGLQARCMAPDSSYTGLVLNEILFDPPPGGADYVELFNNGPYAVPLANLRLGNRDRNGAVAALRPLAADGRCMLPGEWLAFSADTGWIQQQFPRAGALAELASLPSYPNESGSVVLLHADGRLIDEVDYNAGWHHPLIRDPESVALERIDPSATGNDASNWTSAAIHARYGTPGLPNTQQPVQAPALEEKFFRTEMGLRQVLLRYSFPERGYVLSVTAYDFSGREIRQLVRNGICGLQGTLVWDGHGPGGRILPPGAYILVAEAFNLSGKTLRTRRAVGINW
ncbi:MAG: lamin tail domain-containing protein [Flavihumibacter sp.]